MCPMEYAASELSSPWTCLAGKQIRLLNVRAWRTVIVGARVGSDVGMRVGKRVGRIVGAGL